MTIPATAGSAPPARPRRRILLALAAGYALLLALVAFWPTPVDRPLRGTLDRLLAALHERGLPTAIDYAVVEFTANIALFVPVGLLIAAALAPRRWALAVPLGVLISAVIEGGQLLLLEQRTATGLDILANGLGTLLGALLLHALRARADRARRARGARPATEPLPR